MIAPTWAKLSFLSVKGTPLVVIGSIVSVLLITAYAEYGTPVRSHITPDATVMQDNRERREIELITIEPHGFEPAEITRPQGRFVLGLDNRSGLEDIHLRLERADGSRVPVLNSRKRRLSWREEIDLPPGRYVIRETNQREWNCVITITSR
jgi:hypothetical protein